MGCAIQVLFQPLWLLPGDHVLGIHQNHQIEKNAAHPSVCTGCHGFVGWDHVGGEYKKDKKGQQGKPFRKQTYSQMLKTSPPPHIHF